jgi:uncharacterized Zn finger protein
MSWQRHRYYDFFPPSVPRKAKGGIKAQSKRGGFGQSWWAKRWIAVLESFNIGARLGRGRSYARSGQVLSIEIDEGNVTAQVQGSRPKPYDVTIEVKTLPAASWNKLANVLSQQAVFAAKLLTGEMPQDIETAFTKAKLSLFPEKLKDLETDCSCPDWSNPCKHIAAVYYLLGEEFDRDPFLIFKLRGMTREKFVALLGVSAEESSTVRSQTGPNVPESDRPAFPPEPLPAAWPAFWNGNPVADDLFGEVRVPPVAGALLKQAGNFPFWRGREHFTDSIEAVYRSASQVGLDAFVGTW